MHVDYFVKTRIHNHSWSVSTGAVSYWNYFILVGTQDANSGGFYSKFISNRRQ